MYNQHNYTDPFTQQHALTVRANIPEILDGPENKHSTLLICYLSKQSIRGQERMLRLASSVNLVDTIKADVITVGDKVIYKGVYDEAEFCELPLNFYDEWCLNYRLVIEAKVFK
jgi:hypothetical protein